MNSNKSKILLVIATLLICISSLGQGKIYTRKAKIEDFPTRTLKVVSEGSSLLASSIREEISTRWRLSAFEFCSYSEYESLKSDCNYYFLVLAKSGSIAFLSLSKGGKEDDSDNFKKPLELIRIPIANLDNHFGVETKIVGVFVDVLQYFVEDAMASDKTAYGGLSIYNSRKLEGRTIYTEESDIEQAYNDASSSSLLGLIICPSEIEPKSKCYKMLISSDTHEIFYFKESNYSSAEDAKFSGKELKSFVKRYGIISQ